MEQQEYALWFVTGSQHLYGPEALEAVARDAKAVATFLDGAADIPYRVVYQPTLTDPAAITKLCREAGADDHCLGLICWMHTFSPAKMWIAGLRILDKPLLHLHTQFARDIPWASIDMDYMNLHQSAHGGREFGFIGARMGVRRTVVVGHWKDESVGRQIGRWSRAARGVAEGRSLRVARFGDNMRQVAVTEGDKVEAQLRLGYEVHGYGLGDLKERIEAVDAGRVRALTEEYGDTYALASELRADGERHESLKDAAAIELGIGDFLRERDCHAFTDTFENLHGLSQLPGIATQRLMAAGYGFGAEGDWKTAALLRQCKVMAEGLPGGNSFMEDYVYHFAPGNQRVLGAHMLEICPSIAAGRVSCEIHPLGIGGRADPVRLVFDAAAGPAVNVSIIDLGDRFRLLVNTVRTETPTEDLPNLPVARALWAPDPDLPTAAAAWILAGGAHHTCFSQNLTVDYFADFAEMLDLELVVIDERTELRRFRQELRWNAQAPPP